MTQSAGDCARRHNSLSTATPRSDGTLGTVTVNNCERAEIPPARRGGSLARRTVRGALLGVYIRLGEFSSSSSRSARLGVELRHAKSLVRRHGERPETAPQVRLKTMP